MLHFNSELGKCQLVLISGPSPGVDTQCPFDIEKKLRSTNSISIFKKSLIYKIHKTYNP